MTQIAAQRQRRRDQLAKAVDAIGQTTVAEITGIAPAYLYQMSKAKGKNARPVSDDTAREIEDALKFPDGWLDSDEAPPEGTIENPNITGKARRYAEYFKSLQPPVGGEAPEPKSVMDTYYPPAEDSRVSASATPPGYVRLERLAVEVSAGGGAIVGDESEVVEMLDVAEWWAQQNLPRDVSKVKVVTARGDSMAPDIQHGDVLFVDTSRPVFDAPGLYVMNWQGRALVKRLVPEVTKRRLALVSNNPQYPPEHIDADEIDSLRIAGRVCAWWSLRKY